MIALTQVSFNRGHAPWRKSSTNNNIDTVALEFNNLIRSEGWPLAKVVKGMYEMTYDCKTEKGEINLERLNKIKYIFSFCCGYSSYNSLYQTVRSYCLGLNNNDCCRKALLQFKFLHEVYGLTLCVGSDHLDKSSEFVYLQDF